MGQQNGEDREIEISAEQEVLALHRALLGAPARAHWIGEAARGWDLDDIEQLDQEHHRDFVIPSTKGQPLFIECKAEVHPASTDIAVELLCNLVVSAATSLGP